MILVNKIGKMHLVKQYYWLLLPNKQTTTYAGFALHRGHLAPTNAAMYSQRYNCNVSYISPNDFVVLLEVDGKFKKVLTSNGDIGWTLFCEDDNDCFEEVYIEQTKSNVEEAIQMP